MTTEQIIQKINTILIEEFELDAELIVADALLREDLDLDSLDAVDLVVALEKSFGIRVEGKVVEEMRTVGDIHTYVRDNYGTAPQREAAASAAAASK